MKISNFAALLIFFLGSHCLQSQTWTKVLDEAVALPGYPEVFPNIGTGESRFWNGILAHDVQHFQGGVVTGIQTDNSDDYGKELYWTDGNQTEKILPPPVTYNGVEYLGSEFTNPVTISTYASDGENLFMQVTYSGTNPDNGSPLQLSSFVRFDGSEYHTIHENLDDFIYYEEYGLEPFIAYSTGHEMSASNGRAVFSLEYPGINSVTFEPIYYSSVLYYDGEELIEVVDNRDFFESGAGYIFPNNFFGSDNNYFVMNQDGDAFVFKSALVRDEVSTDAIFYYDGTTIHLVAVDNETLFEDAPLLLSDSFPRIWSRRRPVVLDDVVAFAALKEGDSNNILYGWTSDRGVFALPSGAVDFADDQFAVFGDRLTFGISRENGLNFLTQIDVEDSEQRLVSFLNPYQELPNHIEYAKGTNGEMMAAYVEVGPEDSSQLWVTFTPGLRFSSPNPSDWYAGAAELGNGWLYLEWFKSFKPVGENWIYHENHAWLYTIDGNQSDLYLYDLALGRWLWTSESMYPWMYAFGLDGGWVWFFEDGRAGSRFYARGDSGEVIPESDLSTNP